MGDGWVINQMRCGVKWLCCHGDHNNNMIINIIVTMATVTTKWYVNYYNYHGNYGNN